MKRLRILRLLFGLGILLGSVTCAEDPNIPKSRHLVETQAKTILRAAHPLAKFQSLTCDRTRSTAAGCELTYTIGWIGKKEQEFHTELLFGFDHNNHGEITKVTISVLGDSSSVPPFALNKVAVGALRVLLKGLLKESLPEFASEELCREIDKVANAKELLAFWLKHVGNKKE